MNCSGEYLRITSSSSKVIRSPRLLIPAPVARDDVAVDEPDVVAFLTGSFLAVFFFFGAAAAAAALAAVGVEEEGEGGDEEIPGSENVGILFEPGESTLIRDSAGVPKPESEPEADRESRLLCEGEYAWKERVDSWPAEISSRSLLFVRPECR